MHEKQNPRNAPRPDELADAAEGFEARVYPHATPETRRLLVHCRGAIRRFLASDLGRDRKR
jgi:hypothetical protein